MSWPLITSNPTSYYLPLAPCTPDPLDFWPVPALTLLRTFAHAALSLLRPPPREPHVSPPHLRQVWTQTSPPPRGLPRPLYLNCKAFSPARPRPPCLSFTRPFFNCVLSTALFISPRPAQCTSPLSVCLVRGSRQRFLLCLLTEPRHTEQCLARSGSSINMLIKHN